MSKHFLKNLSIRRKQMFVIMLTTSVALLLACASFAVYEAVTFQTAMVQNLSALANIVGNNTAVALDFNDAKSATETLSALRAQPNIIGACIFSKEGAVFAQYDRVNDNITFIPPAKFQTEGHAFGKDKLVLFQPVISGSDIIGVVYLESDMQALNSRLTQYTLITAPQNQIAGHFSRRILVLKILGKLGKPVLKFSRHLFACFDLCRVSFPSISAI